MIRFIKKWIRAALVATAMATAVSTVTSAQPNEPAMESASTADEAATGDASPAPDDQSTDANMSTAIEPTAKSMIPDAVEIEIQRRFNELREKLLDDRAKYIDWWLAVVAIVLTFFGIVISVAGYFSFKRFRGIETEARQNVTASKQYAKEAQILVEEIRAKRGEAESLLEKLNAEKVGEDPDEAGRAAESVQGNPAAPLIDQAMSAAVLLQRQGDIEKAIEKWRAVAYIAEESNNDLAATAWFSVGYLLFQQKKPEDAIAAYDQAIRLKADLAGAYNNRGIAKRTLERYEDAIADHDQAIRLDPNNAGAYTNRGIAKRALERYEDAIADHDQAIRLDPNNAGAYNNRGAVKAVLERYEDAIADYDQAIRLEPDYTDAYNNRGVAKAELERYEDAIADHDQAIRLDPNDAGAYNDRGIAKSKLDRYEDAITDFDQAIRIKPDYAGAYNNRGVAKSALGRIDEARQDFEKARDLARTAGDNNSVALAEQALRDLDNREGQ